ncbi:hypothetical protein [Aurantiacibacter sediminis]|uniref:Uncharacterized protein n=1 Tax=Aurantiacibacter sediminis TaxID=2793064 RepID=A0ABS0N573_9SPHN|nr:hypothetical protein [Aurantiacibacter sediminis]MBH5322931.1 hypothetical protein [Aurantiacibacter sediminis]
MTTIIIRASAITFTIAGAANIAGLAAIATIGMVAARDTVNSARTGVNMAMKFRTAIVTSAAGETVTTATIAMIAVTGTAMGVAIVIEMAAVTAMTMIAGATAHVIVAAMAGIGLKTPGVTGVSTAPLRTMQAKLTGETGQTAIGAVAG